MMRPLPAAFLLLALLGLGWLSIHLLQPPAPVPATAPTTVFSAERAMVHVRQIAREPHAMGTPAHARVRQYLLQQMQALGLQPHVQDTFARNPVEDAGYVGHVYNLVGRLKGTGTSGKAILLMAHYDSQPNARGAGDDGAGVAAILETVRALRQGKPLQHDVLVLLTDGEEYGLYGAQAFLKHRWLQDVALVLNLEARGNAGPSMTFELSPRNGWIAQQYARAAPYPFINSLAYEIYSRMPNNTDFTVFKNAGFTGLNAAFISGFVHYHKATDAPENLSQGSLQQHGSNMLALVRQFGNAALAQTKAPDKVFFNAAGKWVVQYPVGLNLPLVGLVAVLLVATLLAGIKRRALTIGQSIGGFLVYLLLLAVVVGLFWPINAVVLKLLPYTHSFNGVYSADLFFSAYLLLAAGLFMLLSWVALRWLRLYALLMGAFILWFVLLLVVYITAPSATYLLLFPLLFALAGMLLVFLLRWHQEQGRRFGLVMLLWLVPAIVLVMPIVQVVFVAFALQLPMGTVALFVLLLGLLLPLVVLLDRSFSWRGVPLLPVVLLLLGLATTAFALYHEQPTAERPLHSHVSYYLNKDTGHAYWASAFTTTDDWNRQFFPHPVTGPLKEMYPQGVWPYLKNDAQVLDLPAPTAQVLQDSVAGPVRLLRLRLASPRGAAHLELVLQPKAPGALLEASIGGEHLVLSPIQTDAGPVYYMRLHGLPSSKQVTLELRLKPASPLTLHLYDQSIGLPQQLVKQPKQAHVIAEQGSTSNLTVVRKSYTY
ncbi:M20/M25/M40 family metallo-hydrolase [Pontibacter liquoris]|uniref:M20/M25/M40 family metallo-hydrolase n=1 Tax=Pontibacter liquoris TaxID=2905677 RepID=UPI001FA7A15B|nr:M20/M25/M40 family metallo-hydrolase [Pontibacter liquoris]